MKKITTFFLISILLFNISLYANQNKYEGKIRILTSPDYPPFEFIDSTGKITGLDIDIIEEIGKRVNLEFEINKAEFSAIIGALIHNKADVGISGFGITNERKRTVDFAEYNVKNDLGVLTKNNLKFENISDFKNKTIAVQVGSISSESLKKLNKKHNLNIKIEYIKDNGIAIQMLKTAKINGIYIESIVAIALEKNIKDAKFYPIEQSESKYGIAIRKGFSEKNKILEALNSMKKDGTYDKLLNKWLNIDDIKADKNLKIDSLKIIFGAINTLKICFISSLFGIFSALMLSLYRNLKPKSLISKIISGCISIIRGTPIILQLSFWFFYIPIVLNYNITAMEAGILTLAVNSTAYLSEVIRGGLNSLDKGQIDAAISLNLSKFQFYKDVILPQLLRSILPMLTGEFITLIKESAVLSILGVEEITFKGNLVIAQYYTYALPIAVSGLTYYVLCFSVEKIGKSLERRFHY